MTNTPRSRDELISAIRNGDVETVKSILQAGVDDINAPGTRGQSCALITAAETGQADIVHMLVQAGAEVNARTGKYLSTALIQAVRHDKLAVVRQLIKDGVDVNLANDSGHTPLYYSVGGDIRITKLLLEFGADPNIAPDKDVSPLMRAIALKNTAAMQYLIEHHADMNYHSPTSPHATICMWAAAGTTDALRLVINSGVDVNEQDDRGGTALVYAISNKNMDTATMLLDAGADPYITDKYGRNLVEQIREHQKTDFVEEFMQVAAKRKQEADALVDIEARQAALKSGIRRTKFVLRNNL